MLRKGWITLLSLFMFAQTVYATDNVTKTYTLKDLKNVVSNHANCKVLYHDLKNLSKKPIVLQFTKSENATFIVQDQNNKTTNHSLNIIKQNASEHSMNRIVMGALEINHKKVDYVMEISADLNNKNHQYVYPAILAGENAHCFFTALVSPDKKTIATFKKNVQAGNIEEGKDLYTN